MLLLQNTGASPTHSSYLHHKLALIRCSDVIRGLSQRETQLKGAHWLTLRKQLRSNSKSGIERLYKNPKSPENTPKNAKKQQSTEIKRIVDTKIQARQGPSFYIQLGNVNMTSYCDVTNSVYPVIMTTIRHCSILEFGTGASNQAVTPGITRPLHTTAQGPCGSSGSVTPVQRPSSHILQLLILILQRQWSISKKGTSGTLDCSWHLQRGKHNR